MIILGLIFIGTGLLCYWAIRKYESDSIWLTALGIASIIIGVICISSVFL